MTQQTIVTWPLELNLGVLLSTPASVALTNALKNCDNNFTQLFNQSGIGASLTLGTQQSVQGSLILANTVAHAYATTIESSNSASAAWTLTLPVSAGSANYVLQTDGSGVTSWVAQTGGSGTLTIGTTAVSGATAGKVLYSDGSLLQAYSAVPATFGGTGIANDVANTITFTGAHSLGLTLSGNTTLTLPTSGTVVVQGGALGAATATSINGVVLKSPSSDSGGQSL